MSVSLNSLARADDIRARICGESVSQVRLVISECAVLFCTEGTQAVIIFQDHKECRYKANSKHYIYYFHGVLWPCVFFSSSAQPATRVSLKSHLWQNPSAAN